MVGKTVVRQRLDAAGLEQVPGEPRPRREGGRGAEVGEKDLRTRTGPREHRVGRLAEALVGRGGTERGEGATSPLTRSASRTRPLPLGEAGKKHLHLRLAQARERARAGDRLAPCRDGALAL